MEVFVFLVFYLGEQVVRMVAVVVETGGVHLTMMSWRRGSIVFVNSSTTTWLAGKGYDACTGGEEISRTSGV